MEDPYSQDVKRVLDILFQTYPSHPMHEAFQHNPFHMLIAVVLSQRATDARTIPVAQHLFTFADTPLKIIQLPIVKLEEILHPIGFYQHKALALKKLSQQLIERFDGKVPSTEEELLSLPQVGRKTANIMLTMFFNTPQIAVDVHVHRITNRIGWIQTQKPEETEQQLTAIIPNDKVNRVNEVLVRHGQEICRPIRPKCSICPINTYCKKVGVETSR